MPNDPATSSPARDATVYGPPKPHERLAGLCPDTTQRSLLHWLSRYDGPALKPPNLGLTYLVAAAVAYLPVFSAVVLSRQPLWAEGTGALPFLRDWGFACGLLISFPALLLLFITDERRLCESLRQVGEDGVIEPLAIESSTLTTGWARTFRNVNLVSQTTGILLGVTLGLLTLRQYGLHPANSWIAAGGTLSPVGITYGFGVSLLYAMVIIYVVRCVTIACFLRGLVRSTHLRLVPFHPDQCGGLRPVGELGLRNQYTLTILGLNIVVLFLVWGTHQHKDESIRTILLLGASAYLVLGPVVFMAPLLPFRGAMIRAKREWSSEVAGLLRTQFDELRRSITAGQIAAEDEQKIDRLRKLGTVIDELPVWPFDYKTLRTFATAYVVPAGLSILGGLVQYAIPWLQKL
jgi:hypothetical protein